MKTENETTVIAKIKDIQILVNQDSEKRVAIKPICEILEIDYSRQLKRIKDDLIMGSVVGLTPTTGSDGKSYKMQTLPFKYIFPWLLKINAKNVKEEARETLVKYQNECYDVLYNYFSSRSEFIEIRQKQIEEQLDVLKTAKSNFKDARSILNEAEGKLTEIRKFTYEDYQAQKNQTEIDFDEEINE